MLVVDEHGMSLLTKDVGTNVLVCVVQCFDMKIILQFQLLNGQYFGNWVEVASTMR
jgi:hypothetical protein